MAASCLCHGLLEQGVDFPLEYLQLFRANVDKSKWLQITSCASHRKQHLGFRPQNAGTNRKCQINLGSLVHVLSQFQQSSCDGELLQLGRDAPEILQLNQDGSRPAQRYARRTCTPTLQRVTHRQVESFTALHHEHASKYHPAAHAR